MRLSIFFISTILLFAACNSGKQEYDTLIRNGMIYDGNGGNPYKGDIGINNDTIAFIGDLSKAAARNETDAMGNAVAPGFIKTAMTNAMPEEVLQQMSSKVPVQRLGETSDIANAVLFLASDAASYINGTVISVDGGIVL